VCTISQRETYDFFFWVVHRGACVGYRWACACGVRHAPLTICTAQFAPTHRLVCVCVLLQLHRCIGSVGALIPIVTVTCQFASTRLQRIVSRCICVLHQLHRCIGAVGALIPIVTVTLHSATSPTTVPHVAPCTGCEGRNYSASRPPSSCSGPVRQFSCRVQGTP
jgi:hypothetical protein